MLVSIVGARPQFIKLAPLYAETQKKNAKHIIIHTGQHYDYALSAAFFKEFKLPKPDYFLAVGSGTHAEQTGLAMIKIEKILSKLKNKIDFVIVYGDTNSTLAGALAAIKLQLPIAHIEAGLREKDLKIPEEVNRLLTDDISTILFPPTPSAKKNLERENISGKIFLVGDIMVDSLNETLQFLKKEKPKLNFDLPQNYFLLTLHRQENVDDPKILTKILNAIKLSKKQFIFPMHPRTKKRIKEFNLKIPSNVKVISPVDHHTFIFLLQNSNGIITDSGGAQKEAFLLQKRCITVRHVTAWIETLECNANILVNPYQEEESFIRKFNSTLSSLEDSTNVNWKNKIFGEPGVAKRILEVLLNET